MSPGSTTASEPARYGSSLPTAAVGIKPLPEALSIAQELELDLVEVADKANPPVVRIMDYGKYKYEAAQRAKESRKKAGEHHHQRDEVPPEDRQGRLRHQDPSKVEKFLGEGHKVKVTIMFRGREMHHPDLGRQDPRPRRRDRGPRRPGRGLPQAGWPQHGHGARHRTRRVSRARPTPAQSAPLTFPNRFVPRFPGSRPPLPLQLQPPQFPRQPQTLPTTAPPKLLVCKSRPLLPLIRSPNPPPEPLADQRRPLRRSARPTVSRSTGQCAGSDHPGRR